MLDHIGFAVEDYEGAKAFYSAALKPLGISIVMEVQQEEHPGYRACGYGGPGGKPDFWLGAEGRTTPHVHVCFAAENRAAVEAFYKAAIAAGGRDNGPPGIRAHYHPNYYGAFVLDPEGHNIEAVCHTPE
ncbi:VOC family protein [Terrihabitans soli]|uniref:VOC family protein n=1 Tax=Terrihabitans soli TaxID=708113 RepID=UPI001CA35B71|nr:VOC family protein [Terrihabitans soli]